MRNVGSNEAEQIAALENALKYGNVGLDIVIAALKDDRPPVELKAWYLLRDRLNSNIKKALKDYDCLRSSCGVSYNKLQRLLADGQWQKADRETRSLLLGIVGQTSEKSLPQGKLGMGPLCPGGQAMPQRAGYDSAQEGHGADPVF